MAKLAYKHLGGAPELPPLIILHGLLGSSQNWVTAGNALCARFNVYALDLRNHGKSPFMAPMNYEAMVKDTLEFAADNDFDSFHLLGHSMGGKVAMLLACQYPQQVERLIVVDIAPRGTHPRWGKEFGIMNRLPLNTIKSRREAEHFLEEQGIEDWAFRKFLISNLARNDDQGFHWQVNLPLLQQSLGQLFDNPLQPDQSFNDPTLLLRGENSNFIQESDIEHFESHFPSSTYKTIANAGHNPHIDQREAFVKAILNWDEVLNL